MKNSTVSINNTQYFSKLNISSTHRPITYSAPDRGRAIVMSLSVCVFVCPRAYLRNYTCNLHQFLYKPYYLTYSTHDPFLAALQYVLPVLWMTS